MKKEVAIGAARYRILAADRAGQWTAHAERLDNGDKFGVECSGASESEAMDLMARWLEWQAEHAEALDELQRAERSYHRTIAGSAFASPTEGPSAVEMQKDALEIVEAARVRLDEIRARRPACG
jgi:hypothetical protein